MRFYLRRGVLCDSSECVVAEDCVALGWDFGALVCYMCRTRSQTRIYEGGTTFKQDTEYTEWSTLRLYVSLSRERSPEGLRKDQRHQRWRELNIEIQHFYIWTCNSVC